VDEKESRTLSRFSSACYLFGQSWTPTSIDEEFIFEGVASTHQLQISLHTIDRNAVTCQQTVIPVSRLEEDVEVRFKLLCLSTLSSLSFHLTSPVLFLLSSLDSCALSIRSESSTCNVQNEW
jgi:hypothetical protein